MHSSYNRWRTCIEGEGGVQTLVQKGPLIFFLWEITSRQHFPPPLPHSTQITAFTFHGFSFFSVNCFISLNFTGFDWLIERGYRPNCRNHCRQAEKAETTTCFSICERRSPVAVGAGNRELKMETFSGRRQLQPDVTS